MRTKKNAPEEATPAPDEADPKEVTTTPDEADPKEATTTPDEADPKEATTAPGVNPPGRVRPPGHGLQTGRLKFKTGAERLAEVLGLSGETQLEKLCDDAAAEIEKLRAQQPPIPWGKPSNRPVP